MLTKTEIIATTFDLPRPSGVEPVELNGERCIITGEPLGEGYAVLDAISKTTNDFEYLWNAHNQYMSIDAARCFQGSNPKAKPRPRMECSKSMAIIGVVPHEPLISDKAAKEQDRPCWSDLLKSAWVEDAGAECLFILSTDTKTRVWHQPHVRSGILGASTPFTIYDPSQTINKTVLVNWPEMLEDLDLAERVVSAGFWNKFLSTSLFELRKDLAVPLIQIMEWETALQTMRTKPHFNIIQLVAREKEQYKWISIQTETKQLSIPKQSQLALF